MTTEQEAQVLNILEHVVAKFDDLLELLREEPDSLNLKAQDERIAQYQLSIIDKRLSLIELRLNNIDRLISADNDHTDENRNEISNFSTP